MKKILFMIMTVLGWINLTSCNDYLDIVPKGNKIPTTLADFEALLRDEYTIGYIPVTNSLYLANLHTSFLCNLIYPTFSRILLYSC